MKDLLARRYPILGSKPRHTVPAFVVEAHEAQCQRNHYQTTARCAERGGLSWCELAAVLEDRPFRNMATDVAIERCMQIVEGAIAAEAARQALEFALGPST